MGKGERNHRVEFIALGVLVVGLVLLLDWTPVMTLVDRIILGLAQRLTPIMLIGLGLVSGAVVFIGWRARVRFLSSPYWRATTCPRCGSPIHRVHRNMLDKVASKLFLPHARRYRCEQTACGWTGLRHSRRHHNEQ